jgi:N-acetylglucosaminyldiphosphoundecaprenol N-acetyl-beta-D-mannosaminyltransferase
LEKEVRLTTISQSSVCGTAMASPALRDRKLDRGAVVISGSRRGVQILDTFIDAIGWEDAIETILRWGGRRESRFVVTCNVHSVVTGRRDVEHRKALDRADMVTPDGAPIARLVKRRGFPGQERINGPDLMWKVLGAAERHGQSVYFHGDTDSTLARLREVLQRTFPDLRVAGMRSPPFGILSDAQERQEIEAINASGANVIFVALGCPRQEKWMLAHRDDVKGVMIGVGAAFGFHAGVISRAPLWMQRRGLEWLHRLCSEPRRLFRRYLVTNTVFLCTVMRESLALRHQRRSQLAIVNDEVNVA